MDQLPHLALQLRINMVPRLLVLHGGEVVQALSVDVPEQADWSRLSAYLLNGAWKARPEKGRAFKNRRVSQYSLVDYTLFLRVLRFIHVDQFEWARWFQASTLRGALGLAGVGLVTTLRTLI